MPDSQTLLKYLVLIMLVLMTVAIGSFFVGSSSFRDSDVQLNLEASTQATSGDELVYTVSYQNATKVTLSDMEFQFFYPEGSVILKDGIPTSESVLRFSEDALQPGQSGRKEIRIFMVGNRGDIKNAKATMTFKAGSIRSSFEKAAEVSTTITQVPVELTLVAPPNVLSGQSVTYLLDYRNESGEDISDIRFEFTYPEGFTPQSFEPNPTQGNNVWDVGLLRKNSGSRLSLSGVILGSENESKAIKLVLKRKVGDQYVDYQRVSSTTLIANPVVSLDVSVNDAREYSASIGETLRYNILFKNNSRYNLLGLVMSVKLEGDMYDFSTLSLGGGFFDDSTKTLFWNSSVYPGLAAFTSGMNGQIQFSIRLKPQFPATGSGASRDRFVKATVKLATTNVPQGVDGNEIGNSVAHITRITSQPTFNQYLYHQDAQFGSSGPFPLKAGEETTLTVRWQLANPGNDISNAEVVGTLPPDVVWMNNVVSGAGQPTVVYNPNASSLTWKLGTLPFGVGTLAPRYEVAFQLKVRPVASQRTSEIDVLKDVRFTGMDGFTGQPITITHRLLDSGDVVDKPNQGKVE